MPSFSIALSKIFSCGKNVNELSPQQIAPNYCAATPIQPVVCYKMSVCLRTNFADKKRRFSEQFETGPVNILSRQAEYLPTDFVQLEMLGNPPMNNIVRRHDRGTRDMLFQIVATCFFCFIVHSSYFKIPEADYANVTT
jgi:hypothetical protein